MIRAAVLFTDAHVEKLYAATWRELAELAIAAAKRNPKAPVHRVFAFDEEHGSVLEEHKVHELQEALAKGEIPG